MTRLPRPPPRPAAGRDGCRARRSRTTSRSRRSRRRRAASAGRARASPPSTDRSARAPTILRDRHELPDPVLQLLLPGVGDAVAEHLEQLVTRPPGDEDDEAEPELLLVDLVQVHEL